MFNKHNFAIASLIDDEALPPQNGLLITVGGTVEVGGHQIVWVTPPEPQPTLFPQDDDITATEEFTAFVLDQASALKLAKIMPKPKEGKASEMVVIDISTENDGTATLAMNDDARRVIVKAEKLGGKYPAPEPLFAEKGKQVVELRFRASLLVDVLKAFDSFSDTFTMRIYGANAGVHIAADNDGQVMRAVVMPMAGE
jgi:hypothetical protein